MLAFQKIVPLPLPTASAFVAPFPASALGAVCILSTWRRSLEIKLVPRCVDTLAFQKLVPLPSPTAISFISPLAYLPGVQFLLGVRGEGTWRLNMCHGELTS